jgi:hypothetical protein
MDQVVSLRRWVRAALGACLAMGVLGLSPIAPARAVSEGYLDITVQGPDGSPLGSATVIIYEAGQINPNPMDTGWRPPSLDSAGTGVDGVAHFVHDFPPGVSVIQVKVWVEAVGYVGEWYQAAATYTEANSVSIGAGLTNDTPFVALAATLRQVEVYAYDVDSEADLGGVTIGLYDAAGDGSTPSLTQQTSSTGVAQIKIPLGSLPGGLYRLRASRAGYLTQWYLGDPPSGANDFAGAQDLDLSPDTFALPISVPMTAGTPAPFTTAPIPTIVGKAKKGKTLTARPGAWVPSPSRFTYRWFRGSKAIAGATAKTYTLRKSDVGKRISVKVKAILTGYVSSTRTSAKTKPVAG